MRGVLDRSRGAVLAGLLAATAAQAREVDVTPRIVRVALFKNGLAYVTSRLALPAGATRVVLGQLPVPSYGTFWITYPESVKVEGVFARLEEVSREVSLVRPTELLRENVGRTVRLNYFGQHEVTGKLLDVIVEDLEAPPGRYVMGGGEQPRSSDVPGQLALIKTGEGIVALRVDQLSQVSFPDAEPKLTGSRTSRRPVVRIELAEGSRAEVLTLSYLASGMSWAPSYRIELSEADTAQLSASAEVINEVGDLDAVELELVTGYPKLDFASVPSPLALDQTLAQFLEKLQTRGLRSTGEQQTMMAQAMAETVQLSPRYGLATEGWAAEDLFFYPIRSLSLQRGEVALLPLFTAPVPYEHVYTWEVPDLLDRDGRQLRSDDERVSKQVWHVCRLTNSSGLPLTTAPVQFVSEGRIVGQSLSRYCNAGATIDIPINRALGIAAEHAEIETSRERRAVTSASGATYDKVGVQGELSLRSSLAEAASVEVTKRITGEVVDTSDGPQITRTARGLRSVNPSHELKWSFVLAPGEEKLLRYEYSVLIR